jgi:predicted O-methyltransferase YrrM
MVNTNTELEKIKEYAEENNVPIMTEEGINFLTNYIKKHNVKKILEIGAAIGFSAIMMALVDDEIEITTIERDEKRYLEAVKNIKKFQLEDRINLIYKDAFDVNITDSYDLVFIDASKGHSIDFFNRYSKNLKDNGVIITDNLSFHGLVEDESLAVTKNQRGIVKKIKNFINFLDTNEEYHTEYVNVGDKISITRRKSC